MKRLALARILYVAAIFMFANYIAAAGNKRREQSKGRKQPIW